MISRFSKIAALSLGLGLLGLGGSAQAGGWHGGHGWHSGSHGGHHFGGISFGFYPGYTSLYDEPYTTVNFGSPFWGHRYYRRHKQIRCIRFPCP